MIYDASNALGAEVWDVEGLAKIDHVLFVDMHYNEVVQLEQPPRVVNGEFVTTATRFNSIRPIFGGEKMPVLFHCYGRLH